MYSLKFALPLIITIILNNIQLINLILNNPQLLSIHPGKNFFDLKKKKNIFVELNK